MGESRERRVVIQAADLARPALVGDVQDHDPPVDVAEVARFAGGLDSVVAARDYRFMCSEPGQEMIKKDMLMNPKSGFYNLLIGPRTGKKEVVVKLCCATSKWEQVREEARQIFERRAAEGNMAAKGVLPAVMRTVKGPTSAVVASFQQVIEPPLIDVGEGHMVACYLFKGPAK